ncbi:hypothetical protein Acor_75850 [Acrocarpospora corrugata]|uniref:Uncharacterized protein n=1 Tax=Acrocarpospora corrugata TaxID=35763 RepID=A0A5M3W8W2_9ACTN|nr:hypothetical protein [Acrocarpospora corrugata]GES05517.1 hypothetical protein Acor_75850 [Acrocarpospora corrugata]
MGFQLLGQLGDGAQANRLTPIRVPGLTGVTAIDAGPRPAFSTSSHTLAIRPVTAPRFRLETREDTLDLAPGGTATAVISVLPLNDSRQVVTLNTAGIDLPPGVTANFGSKLISVGESVTVTFTADPQTTPSHGKSSSVTIIGTASLPASSATTTLDIRITDPVS